MTWEQILFYWIGAGGLGLIIGFTWMAFVEWLIKKIRKKWRNR